jgi:hypothetical protein
VSPEEVERLLARAERSAAIALWLARLTILTLVVWAALMVFRVVSA